MPPCAITMRWRLLECVVMGRQIYVDELTHQLVLDDGELIDNVVVDKLNIDFPSLNVQSSSPVTLHPPASEVRLDIRLVGDYRASQKISRPQLSSEPLEKVKLRRIKDDES